VEACARHEYQRGAGSGAVCHVGLPDVMDCSVGRRVACVCGCCAEVRVRVRVSVGGGWVCVRVCLCLCACACKALQGRAASGDTTQHLAGSGQAMTAVQVWAGSMTMALPWAFALAGWLGGRVGAELGKKREAERSAMEQQRIQADARRARRAWIGALAAAVRDEVQVGSGLVLSCGWWRRLRAAATAPRQGRARQSKAKQGKARREWAVGPSSGGRCEMKGACLTCHDASRRHAGGGHVIVGEGEGG
jgi:hypothetical protein